MDAQSLTPLAGVGGDKGRETPPEVRRQGFEVLSIHDTRSTNQVVTRPRPLATRLAVLAGVRVLVGGAPR